MMTKVSKYYTQKSLNINHTISVEKLLGNHFYCNMLYGLESLLEVYTQPLLFWRVLTAWDSANKKLFRVYVQEYRENLVDCDR